MSAALPTVEYVYQNHMLDSTRWEKFNARDDDIVVASSLKSGTTWMQMIVLHLLAPDPDIPIDITESPWLDSAVFPLDEVIGLLDAQRHRRCIKTHLPLDGLIYYPNVRYILVARDARDVFMSLWNHYRHYTPAWVVRLNEIPVSDGRPFPTCPDDIRVFWQRWITTGWFEWESEGFPFWSNMRHTQTWWAFRHLPNVLLVHYNDLLADLAGGIQRVADYLEIEVSETRLAAITDAVTFATVKKNAEQIMPNMRAVQGGATTFFNKGTNGRWRDVLTESDVALYHAAAIRELTPDCLRWLENRHVGE